MRCQRCQGCMISDHFMDLQNASGEIDFKGWRCLNCGDITTPSSCDITSWQRALLRNRGGAGGESVSCICMPVREGAEGVSHYSVG